MTVFASAIDDIFADLHLARGGLWRIGGVDPALPVRLILRRPDRIVGLADTGIVAGIVLIDVRTTEAPSLAEGDTLEIEAVLYLVQGQPVRDGERLVWTAEARRL